MIMSDPGAVFLDTETTGLDNSAEIIEISVVDCSGNALLDTLVRPFSPIPPDAIAVHGISGEMVQDAPAWGDVFPELARLVQHRRVVVYNAPFDYRMVQQMNSRCGITSDLRDWECAMQQYSRYTGVWHERYGNYRWHRLTDALAQFGHYQAGHRAMVDAQACRLVVDGMARSGS
jgi:DNA polymerase-3 subunit epsilon